MMNIDKSKRGISEILIFEIPRLLFLINNYSYDYRLGMTTNRCDSEVVARSIKYPKAFLNDLNTLHHLLFIDDQWRRKPDLITMCWLCE